MSLSIYESSFESIQFNGPNIFWGKFEVKSAHYSLISAFLPLISSSHIIAYATCNTGGSGT